MKRGSFGSKEITRFEYTSLGFIESVHKIKFDVLFYKWTLNCETLTV